MRRRDTWLINLHYQKHLLKNAYKFCIARQSALKQFAAGFFWRYLVALVASVFNPDQQNDRRNF